MIINANSLLPHLKEKVRPTKSDTSRHLLCPDCGKRTRLNTLGDGRKKCTVCGKKFRIHKVTDDNKLLQCAEILLCFCLDLSVHTGDIHVQHEKSRCKWCKSKIRAGGEKPPVFGIQLKDSGEVYIDPLKDDEAVLHFHTYGSKEEAPGRREGYAGFICCGKFHRFTKDERVKEGSDQVWTWIRERVRTHHGIWKRNTGYYLKELEWRYNHRSLDPDLQAKKIIELMPKDFLTSWALKTEAEPVKSL